MVVGAEDYPNIPPLLFFFNATFVRQVVQAEGPDMVVGAEDYPGIPPLILTYHRHAYGLGEHYNSVLPTTTTTAS